MHFRIRYADLFSPGAHLIISNTRIHIFGIFLTWGEYNLVINFYMISYGNKQRQPQQNGTSPKSFTIYKNPLALPNQNPTFNAQETQDKTI